MGNGGGGISGTGSGDALRQRVVEYGVSSGFRSTPKKLIKHNEIISLFITEQEKLVCVCVCV